MTDAVDDTKGHQRMKQHELNDMLRTLSSKLLGLDKIAVRYVDVRV